MTLSTEDRRILTAAMKAAVVQARREVDYCRSYGQERVALEAKLASVVALNRHVQRARQIEVV